MQTQNTAPKLEPDATDGMETVEATRSLVAMYGRPVARQTVFSLGVRGQLDVRTIRGRFYVSRRSIDAYRARHNIV